MESSLDHVQVNVRVENMDFYKEFMAFLGWNTILEMEGYFGAGGSSAASLWFAADVKDVPSDYDAPGLNHVGIAVFRQSLVDETIAWLKERGIEGLFETPRHREVPGREGDTYYQVMFESPDGALFEVLYIGPKS